MSSAWESLDNLFGTVVNTATAVVGAAGSGVADRIQKELGPEAPPPTQASRPEAQADAVVQIPQNGPEHAAVAKQAIPTPAQAIKQTVNEYLPYIAIGLLVVGVFAIRGAR